MTNRAKIVFIAAAAILSISANNLAPKENYKCLIQLSNYGGEGAYVVASIINSSGAYDETIIVCGNDEKWYRDIPEWFKFWDTDRASTDGITGASISSGGRKINVFSIDPSKINKGYKLRFETSVEDQEYHKKDLEIELTDEVAGQTFKGSGYIRYVKILKG